jgi:hypothetical protein
MPTTKRGRGSSDRSLRRPFGSYVGEAFMPDAFVSACQRASRLKPLPTTAEPVKLLVAGFNEVY